MSPLEGDPMNSRWHSLVETVRQVPRTTWWCVGLTALAIGLRLYGISYRTLDGDEFGSLKEARTLGLNWNSIGYFVLMHWWINIGNSELILRLPAVLFGAAIVPLMCALGRTIGSSRLGFVAGLLSAISPFAIAHAQEVRFYTFFPFATSLAILGTLRFAAGKRSLGDKILLIFGLGLTVASHFLGILVVACCAASLLLVRIERRKRLVLLLIIAVLFLCSMALLMVPPVYHWVNQFYAEHANTTSGSSPGIVSLSFVNFVKVAAGVYFFTFGYSAYPLWLWLVLPGIVLYLLLVYFGLRRLVTTEAPMLIVAFSTVAFLGTYLVLDPIGGGWASGVSPRHVAYFWPVFILVVSAGVDHLDRMFRPGLFATVLLSMVCLVLRWNDSWTYGSDTDWRSAIAFFKEYETPGNVLIYDGRSHDALQFYDHDRSPRINAWAMAADSSQRLIASSARVLFITSDYQDDNRLFLSRALASLQEGFAVRDARVEYPLFQYVLDRRDEGRSLQKSSGEVERVNLPLEIYDLRFQDLQLPLLFEYLGQEHEIIGQTGLPTMARSDSLSAALPHPRWAEGLFIFSNCTDVPGPEDSSLIARLSIRSTDGEVTTYLLRYGRETGDWLRRIKRGSAATSGQSQGPDVAFSWDKPVHMVGQKSYDGAWWSGKAKVYAAYFKFEHPLLPQSISLVSRISAPAGRFHVWGLSLGLAESAHHTPTGRSEQRQASFK